MKCAFYGDVYYINRDIICTGIVFYAENRFFIITNDTICPDEPEHTAYERFHNKSTYKYCWGISQAILTPKSIINDTNFRLIMSKKDSYGKITINNEHINNHQQQ